MGWPGPADYNGVIQNPKAAFRDPRLKDCAVETQAGQALALAPGGGQRDRLPAPQRLVVHGRPGVHDRAQGRPAVAVPDGARLPPADQAEMHGRVRLRARRHPGQRPVAAGPDAWSGSQGKTLGVWFREAVERQRQRGHQADGPRVDQADLRAPLAPRSRTATSSTATSWSRTTGWCWSTTTGCSCRRWTPATTRTGSPGRTACPPTSTRAAPVSSCRRPSTTSPPGSS